MLRGLRKNLCRQMEVCRWVNVYVEIERDLVILLETLNIFVVSFVWRLDAPFGY